MRKSFTNAMDTSKTYFSKLYFGGKKWTGNEFQNFRILKFWFVHQMYDGQAHLMLNFGVYDMLNFEENGLFQFWPQKKTPVYEVKLFSGANVENFMK